MVITVLPYLFLIVLVGTAAILLTSKKLAERMVEAGILPRALLGGIPILQSVIRIFGVGLIAMGFIKIGIDSGWVDAQLLSRYAFAGCLILLGIVLLFFTRRD